MNGTSRRRKMINLINLDKQRVHDVVMYQLEIVMTDPVLDIILATCKKIVSNNNFVSQLHEEIYEMWTDETRASSYLQERKLSHLFPVQS